MLKDIAETLVNAGHDVDIVTSSTGDEEHRLKREDWSKSFNINIQTVQLGTEKHISLFRKGFNAIYFGLWIFKQLLSLKPDVVMVATTPPVVTATIVRWASKIRKFKYVYHCQDIHPEAMLLNQSINDSFIYKALFKLDKKNIDNAWKVITLSNDMKNSLSARSCRTDHVHLINNFIFQTSSGKQKHRDSSKIRFLFSGSLGRFQNLQLLLESLRLLAGRDDIDFVFMGDGIMRKKIEEYINEHCLDYIRIVGQKPVSEAIEAMTNSDFGIVSLSPGICNVAYPSKSIMYLGNGLPVLALVEKKSDLAKFIESNRIGYVVEPTNADEISSQLQNIINNFKDHPISREHVLKVADDNFDKELILNKFKRVFSNEEQ